MLAATSKSEKLKLAILCFLSPLTRLDQTYVIFSCLIGIPLLTVVGPQLVLWVTRSQSLGFESQGYIIASQTANSPCVADNCQLSMQSSDCKLALIPLRSLKDARYEYPSRRCLSLGAIGFPRNILSVKSIKAPFSSGILKLFFKSVNA